MKEWVPYKLKEITTKIGSGSTPTGGKEAYHQSGITLVRSLNVYDFVFELENLAFINEAQAKKLNGVTIEKDDILLNITGASVGRCTIIPEYLLPARVNQHVSIIRCNKEIVDAKFLLYCINSASYKDALMSIADSGATREALTKDDIEKFQVLLPTLQLQQCIASILSAYDDLIEVNNQRIKLLEETARELYKEWFVRMRFPGYKQAKFMKGVPEGWEMRKLKECCGFKYGTMPKQELIKEKGYPIYSGYGIVGFYEKYMFEDKTLIVVARGVGGTGDIKLTPLNCWLTNLAIAIFPNNINLIKYFLYYTLSAIDLRYLDSGSAQSQITIADLGNLKLLVPNFELQRRFEEIIIPIEDQLEILQQQNTQLRQIRDRLLPRLISGKLEVKGEIVTLN